VAIVHLTRTRIDVSKWDRSISKSYNGLVYAYSWYLDIVCSGWEALVEGDYERVMPLTVAEKYNVPYIYQPYFTQQLGVFSISKLNASVILKFINLIPEKYKYIELNLNSYNNIIGSLRTVKEKTTFELDLILPYKILQQRYNNNTRRNLSRAISSKISIKKGISSSEIVQFKQRNASENENIKDYHYEILQKLIDFSINYKFGETYGVYNHEGELISVAFFVVSHFRAIFLLASSNEEGREKSAMFLLLDSFIKTYAERNLTLDFEGSNIDGIARFYSGFGAFPSKYYSLKINNLPWFMKLLKQ